MKKLRFIYEPDKMYIGRFASILRGVRASCRSPKNIFDSVFRRQAFQVPLKRSTFVSQNERGIKR